MALGLFFAQVRISREQTAQAGGAFPARASCWALCSPRLSPPHRARFNPCGLRGSARSQLLARPRSPGAPAGAPVPRDPRGAPGAADRGRRPPRGAAAAAGGARGEPGGSPGSPEPSGVECRSLVVVDKKRLKAKFFFFLSLFFFSYQF